MNNRPILRWLGPAALLVATAACGADLNDTLGGGAAVAQPAGAVTVNGVEKEWTISTDVHSVKAGPVTFAMKNQGDLAHEMLVIRTDLPDGKLPVDSDDLLNENGSNSKSLGKISVFPSGQSASLSVKLKAGKYQLVCNVSGHYTKGMHVEFTVT